MSDGSSPGAPKLISGQVQHGSGSAPQRGKCQARACGLVDIPLLAHIDLPPQPSHFNRATHRLAARATHPTLVRAVTSF